MLRFFLLISCTEDDDNVINVTLPPSQNGWTVVVAPTQILVFQTHSSDPPTLLCLSTRVDANAPSTTSSPPLICTRAHVDVPSNGVAPISDADSLTKADVPTKATAKLTARTTGGGAPGTQDISTTTARVDPTIDVTAGMDALDLGGYVSESSQVPSHLRDCVPDERFRVSKELQAQYPPMTDIGWKELSWVVVIRGREVGVFHDFWYAFSSHGVMVIDLCFD
jgi:hypothetical protein